MLNPEPIVPSEKPSGKPTDREAGRIFEAFERLHQAIEFDPPRRETYRDALEEARVWLMERYGKSLPPVPPASLSMYELLQAALPREKG